MEARDQMNEHGRHTEIIAVGNQKGGVGKTTNTLHIAAALGELGHKCLVIDLDGNCGATRGCGLEDGWLGTFEVLLGDQEPEDVIVRTDPAEQTELPENVELLPARRNLEQFEEECRRRNKFADPTTRLGPVLNKLRGLYDFIFLDTAPNASAPTIASYLIADWFILSTEASRLSVDGLRDALTDIKAVRDEGNSNLRLLGVIMCKVDSRTRVASSYIERIRQDFAAAGEMGAFETHISRATAVERAQSQGKTLFQTEPTHRVADEYRSIVRELLRRLEAARGLSAQIEAKPNASIEVKEAARA